MSFTTSLASLPHKQDQYLRASRDPLGICSRSASTSRSSSSSFQKVFSEEIAQETFRYLRPNELALKRTVCRYWNGIINTEITWKDQCKNQGFPARLPDGISCRQIIKDFYPSMFGKDFYTDYIGDVGVVPPIPEHFIIRAYLEDPVGEKPAQLAKDTFQLVLDPEFITIELDANSPPALDANGNLIEQASSSISEDECKKGEGKKTLKVGSTITNIGKITAKYLKKGVKIGFSQHSWPNIFEQHGNKCSPSSWSFQRVSVVDRGFTYAAQQDRAIKAGLEVLPLKARILFNLFTRIRSGVGPDTIVARTSTVTLSDNIRHPRQSTVYWSGCNPFGLLELNFYTIDISIHVGAAVGVPAKSSKNINDLLSQNL
ncbi:MAG TPA: F-box protein [Chlamydiales bacterium]|nr:F-box protein [Chlamydiales bacterium]